MDSEDLIYYIQEIKKGNEHVWNTVYKNLYCFAEEVLRRFELSREEKQDIIHDAFEKLHRSIKNFKGFTKGQFLQYFKTICINCFNDYKNSFNREIELSSEIPDTANPLKELQNREVMEKVFDALKDEPLKNKEIFLLKLKGYKERQIGQMLNIPAGTVASTYSRILNKLRRKILKMES